MEQEVEKHTVQYWGNAEDIISAAIDLGWDYCEDEFVDEYDYIDWDMAIEAAIKFLKTKNVSVEYN